MTSYTTRTEAIARQIVDPIEASETVADAYQDYDVDGIVDELIHMDGRGFVCAAEHDASRFWAVVAEHAH